MTKFTLRSLFSATFMALSLSLGLAISGVAIPDAQAQGALNIDEILSAANRAAGQDRLPSASAKNVSVKS